MRQPDPVLALGRIHKDQVIMVRRKSRKDLSGIALHQTDPVPAGASADIFPRRLDPRRPVLDGVDLRRLREHTAHHQSGKTHGGADLQDSLRALHGDHRLQKRLGDAGDHRHLRLLRLCPERLQRRRITRIQKIQPGRSLRVRDHRPPSEAVSGPAFSRSRICLIFSDVFST